MTLHGLLVRSLPRLSANCWDIHLPSLTHDLKKKERKKERGKKTLSEDYLKMNWNGIYLMWVIKKNKAFQDMNASGIYAKCNWLRKHAGTWGLFLDFDGEYFCTCERQDSFLSIENTRRKEKERRSRKGKRELGAAPTVGEGRSPDRQRQSEKHHKRIKWNDTRTHSVQHFLISVFHCIMDWCWRNRHVISGRLWFPVQHRYHLKGLYRLQENVKTLADLMEP